jgi:5-methylcytosine-specific restriction endonuclease McrA
VCGSTLRLEFDHVVPRGRGGSSEAANVRLLCRFHDQSTVRATYGDDLMDRFAREVPGTSEPVAA